jgi:leader peptidase (prepilin peptidase) / N-methyltransferase
LSWVVSVSAGVGGLLVGVGLGAAAGPFLAGLTLRVPDKEPLLTGDGWRGAPGGGRRVGVVTGLAVAGCGAVGGGVGLHPVLAAYLWLAAVGVVLMVIDVERKLLPDRLTLPSYPVGAALLAVAALADGHWAAWLRAVEAGAAVFALFFLLAFISPRSLGFGDVKLAGVLALFLGYQGWGVVLLGFVGGFALGALTATVLLAGRRVGWKGELAFGPALIAAAIIAASVGHRVLDAYLSAAGVSSG